MRWANAPSSRLVNGSVLGSRCKGSCVRAPRGTRFCSSLTRPCPVARCAAQLPQLLGEDRASRSRPQALPPSLRPQHCTLGGVVLPAPRPHRVMPEHSLPACFRSKPVHSLTPHLLQILDPDKTPNLPSASDPCTAPVPAHPPQRDVELPPAIPEERLQSFGNGGQAAPSVRGCGGGRGAPTPSCVLSPVGPGP